MIFLLGLVLSGLHGVEWDAMFPGGTWENLGEPVHLVFHTADMFTAVESITRGFLHVQGHHSLLVCAFTHLSHAQWQWLYSLWRLDVPEIVKIMCHCEISHTWI